MTTTQPTNLHFHAGNKLPGYLPDECPAVFSTWDEAKRYIIAELLNDADSVASWNEEHDCDDVPCPTLGDDCPEGNAATLTFGAEDLNLESGPDWSAILVNRSYWIHVCGCAAGQAEMDDEQGLVRCSSCDERHWYLTETDGMTHMASLPGFTCGIEEDEEDEDEEKPERTVWQLARLADCFDPDSVDSPGAAWLVMVARDAEELAEDQAEDMTDGIAERADACVPIYTHELWATFVDLGAYQEDVSELLGCERDLTKAASVALYMIAERLLTALLADAA